MASPADGGASLKHRLAGPTPAIAASLRVQANEAPAHGFSGGRTVQGAMFHAPDVAAQSGKVYDADD
jgi:hypothetical protein